jgi:hypothetical protein
LRTAACGQASTVRESSWVKEDRSEDAREPHEKRDGGDDLPGRVAVVVVTQAVKIESRLIGRPSAATAQAMCHPRDRAAGYRWTFTPHTSRSQEDAERQFCVRAYMRPP